MKHILDNEFKYTPSFETDIRKTFRRIRRQSQATQKPAENVKRLEDAVRRRTAKS